MDIFKRIIELSDYESVELMELNDQIEIDGGHDDFINQWDENLENQGFIDRAESQFSEEN